jgi:hypothetical protein
MTPTSYRITSSMFLLAFAVLAVAILACGSSETIAPTAVPTGPGTGPQTVNEAIERVRQHLGEKNFENVNCLETLEATASVEWNAVALDDFNFSVTLRVDPPRLLHNVHTWAIDKRAGRVESSRPTC